MKKIIFAAVVAVFALVSCSKKDNRACYEVEYILPAQEEVLDENGELIREAREESKQTLHKWASAEEIEVCRKNWESMGYKNILTKVVTQDEEGTAIKTMADCLQ